MKVQLAPLLLFTVSKFLSATGSNTTQTIRSVRKAAKSPPKTTEGVKYIRKMKKDKANGGKEKRKGKNEESDDNMDLLDDDDNSTDYKPYDDDDSAIEMEDADIILSSSPTYFPSLPNENIAQRPRISTLAFNTQNAVWHHGATSASSKGTLTFEIPETTKVDDTLFLFLSRTDHLLPLNIDGWTRGAECFKTHNRQDDCMRAAHCIERDGPYCLKFLRGNEIGNGRDLATVMFYRRVTEEDPCEWTIELPGRTMAWAIVTAIPNVNHNDPVFRFSGTSCDVAWESVFPSVYGRENDVLLLSQSFDDNALKKDFLPPETTEILDFINSADEAGYLFAKKIDDTGMTGDLRTGGVGGPKCKDALLSVVVNRNV